MVRIGWLSWPRAAEGELTPRAKVLLTLSNTLMLVGAVLLLYVGGLYANAEYGRYAARGDTDVPAPQPVSLSDDLGDLSAEPAPFVPAPPAAPSTDSGASGSASAPQEQPAAQEAPALPTPQELPSDAATDGRVTGVVPSIATAIRASTVTRVIIPAIDVDSKVVTVGWDIKQQGGQRVAVWQVAEYAVGHHLGSANPGEGGNIVLAGHVGGYGKVFKELYRLEPGDAVTLYSQGKEYRYTVSEKVIVDEEGVSAEKQAANAQYIAPTDHEVITMVTCWPPTGKDRFSQRVIVRAVPFRGGQRTDDGTQ